MVSVASNRKRFMAILHLPGVIGEGLGSVPAFP